MDRQQNIYQNINQPCGTPVVVQPTQQQQAAALAAQQSTAPSSIQVSTNFRSDVCSGAMVPLNTTIAQTGVSISHAQGDFSIYLAPNGSYLCNYRTTCYYNGGSELRTVKTGLHVNGANYTGSTASAVIPRCTACDLSGTCIINTGDGSVNTPLGLRNRSGAECCFYNTTVTVVKIG